MDQSFEEQTLLQIHQILQHAGLAPDARIGHILERVLSRRSLLIEQYVLKHCGSVVHTGPFASMQYLNQSAGSALIPKLLGTYERELHDCLAEIIRTPYRRVLNIGCGEGYYAVGLARSMPTVSVVAFDSDARAQTLCRQLAELNGVGDRVEVHGICNLSHIQDHAQTGRVLVVCDCEGGEVQLLDPAKAPALLKCDILVEMHDFLSPNISRGLMARFALSHEIKLIPQGGRNPFYHAALARLSQLDQFIAVWECRPGPTPWAFMTARVG